MISLVFKSVSRLASSRRQSLPVMSTGATNASA